MPGAEGVGHKSTGGHTMTPAIILQLETLEVSATALVEQIRSVRLALTAEMQSPTGVDISAPMGSENAP